MELIDDWGKKARVGTGAKGPVPADLPVAIQKKLAALDLPIINVSCYEDVGYPWVQVVLDRLVHPAEALRIGDALVAAAGAANVYLNSLRPCAVYFVLEPAFVPQPDLKASRYGATLAEIKKAWRT
jgi:hypothetical protein